MPFTCDSRSMLEQGLVVTMPRSERHVAPSAHRIVATLMAETAPASNDSEGCVADSPDSAGEAGSAAAFEAAMASDLAWFEGGQRVKGITDDHQLEALARTGFLREQIRTGAASLHRACEIVRETRELDDAAADHVARTTLAPTRDGAGLSGAPVPAAAAPGAARRRHRPGGPPSGPPGRPGTGRPLPPRLPPHPRDDRLRPRRRRHLPRPRLHHRAAGATSTTTSPRRTAPPTSTTSPPRTAPTTGSRPPDGGTPPATTTPSSLAHRRRPRLHHPTQGLARRPPPARHPTECTRADPHHARHAPHARTLRRRPQRHPRHHPHRTRHPSDPAFGFRCADPPRHFATQLIRWPPLTASPSHTAYTLAHELGPAGARSPARGPSRRLPPQPTHGRTDRLARLGGAALLRGGRRSHALLARRRTRTS